MSTHYNAFISYKHAELDNKIAATIERSLEHYHIPRKIQKKTGVKRIERIFRDTDELPITSDLSGTIAEALENADYLIVICSTNTCKSMWVEREIKLFLQNHTQDQILTVLADGEPVDVVPEILKNKEVTRINEQGIEETVLVPVEPLSCDFRIPAREAKNTELPRLAASLIGCEYNELMDRQRQYKMKRLTAVFAGILAIALGFAGYMFYSKNQINESYRASLISQSKYLANEAEKLLDSGDRIDALHLALHALPSEEMPNRPVTTEAVSAITKATLAYDPKDISNMQAIWNYEVPSTVVKMAASPDYKLFAALDKAGNFNIWDLKNNKKLAEYIPPNSFLVASNFEFLPDNKMIVVGTNFIGCLDSRTVEVIWEDYFINENLVDESINFTSDGNILLALSGGKFRVYSPADGKIVSEYTLPEEMTDDWYKSFSDFTLSSVSIGNTVLSSDNSKIAFSVYNSEEKGGICVYDIKSGKAVLEDLNADYITDISFPTADNLVVTYNMDTWGSNHTFLNTTTTQKDYDKVICFDPTDLSEKWEKEFLVTDVELNSDLINLNKNNSLAYFSGDRSEVWDLSTGEVLQEYVFADPVVYALFDEEDDRIYYVTESGGMAFSDIFNSENKDTINTVSYFIGDINNVFMGAGVFVNQRNSNSIIRYSADVYDRDWTSYEDAPETVDIYKSYLDENIAAVLTEKEGESVILDLYDPSLKKHTQSVELSDDSDEYYHMDFLGTYEGKLLLSYSRLTGGTLGLITVDYSTGEVTADRINKYYFDHIDYTDYVKYENGKIAFVEEDESKGIIVMIYDVSTGETDEYCTSEKEKCNDGGLYFFEKQGLVYLAWEQDYIVDINKNDIRSVSYDNKWDGTVCVSMNEDGTLIAASDGRDIVIKDISTVDKEDVKATISILGVETHRPVFHKEKRTNTEILIVPFTDGNLCRYNASTGELIGKTDYFTAGGPDYNSTFTVDSEHSCIYLHYSTMINIIDIDNYIDIGFVYGSLGYHAPTDTFVCTCEDEEGVNRLGYFRHYTLDDLIKKAKDILQDHEMPQEQKDAYGIG